MDKESKIWSLIVKYLDDNLSTEQAEELENWLNESSENRWTLNIVNQIWKASEDKSQEALLKELNLEQDWGIIAEKIDEKPENVKEQRVEKFRKIRKKQRLFSNLLKVAALILVAVTSVFLTLQFASVQDDAAYEPVFKEITTKSAERASIQLGDGSSVMLNSGSKLITPDIFESNKRVVELQGQAFFEIKPDSERPFYVHTNKAVIEVVGTSFDVRSYDDENEIRVVVRDGAVSMSSSLEETNRRLLSRGDIGSLNRLTMDLHSSAVDDIDQYLGWMEGRLIFKSTPVPEVFAHLQRWFDVDIKTDVMSENLANKKFTADLKPRTIDDVMEVMAMSMDIDYIIEDDTVTIKN